MPLDTTEAPQRTSKQALRTLQTATVITAIATYSHFLGYAYIKGKLAAIGFSNVEISPSVNASISEVAGAINEFFRNLDSAPESPFSSLLFPGALLAFVVRL